MTSITGLFLVSVAAMLAMSPLSAADAISWPGGARVAVSLSYDDALNSQLDHAVPALDRHGIKASFYPIMSAGPLRERFAEWRALASRGHELGNHTIYHPCSGSLPDRDWVAPANDMDTRTVAQMKAEIVTANTFLHAIDGKTARTFTPPCNDLMASGENYLPAVTAEFVGIKGQDNGMPPGASQILAPDGHSGEALVVWVKENSDDGRLLNIIFHGVGGDYLSVSAEAHETLLRYLAGHPDTYYVDTYLNILQHAGKQH